MYAAWGELWAYADPVSIDGPARTIRINPEIVTVTTTEIYSAWVRWAALYDDLKYLPAMRTVGLDALPGGQVTGLFVFLMNGWQIVIDHQVTVDGIVYHDDGIPVFDVRAGGVTNKVAALAYGVNTAGGGGATAAEVWAHPTRLVTNTIPTAVQVRQEIDANSTSLATLLAQVLTEPGIAAAVIAALPVVQANLVQVRGQTIDGSGSETDPWGPQ